MTFRTTRLAAGVAALVIVWVPACWAQVSVTTYHNDIGRTGVNSQETILNATNVAPGSFGKLYSLPVDAQIYAQPLYVPSVAIPGQGTHNILYVATMNNSVYAFDADSSTPIVYWAVNLGTAVPCLTLEPSWETICEAGIQGTIGILATPVIDVADNALFVVAETYVSTTQTAFELHSLNLTTGKEKAGSPAVISGQVAGAGQDSTAGVLAFNPYWHLQRPGLSLVNGNIYIGFASHGDGGPYHGWLFGYSELTLRRTVIQCMSPNYWGNGIWQGGAAFSSDGNGNVYLQTGNGSFNASLPGGTEWGEAVLKMSAIQGMAITSYFVPSDEQLLDTNDYDVGAGGTIVLPGPVTLTYPMLVAGGKDGNVFLLNTNTLGGYNSTDAVVQEFQALTNSNPDYGSAHYGGSVFYNNALYFWGSGDVLKQFAFSGDSFSLLYTGSYQTTAYETTAPSMSLSSSGLTPGTGVLWAVHAQLYSDGFAWPAELHAYDASNVGNELWNSGTDSSSANPNYSGSWAKFVPPTIANGKVYLATFDGVVNVFGLLPQ
jgi:hypothetical protein